MNRDTALLIGPRVGKLYKVTNPLGVDVAFLNSASSLPLKNKDIFLVTSSELLDEEESRHWSFSFTIILKEKIHEDLIAFPVWFDHNFELIQ